jgi:hypothetical protein
MTDTMSHEATELYLYVSNTQKAYRNFFLPCVINLAKHKAKGEFNERLALKSLFHVATQAAKAYNQEHGSAFADWYNVFPVWARKQCAEALFDSAIEHMEDAA